MTPNRLLLRRGVVLLLSTTLLMMVLPSLANGEDNTIIDSTEESTQAPVDPAIAELQAKYPDVEILSDARFEEHVFPIGTAPTEQRPYIIMFFAPWCQHCRAVLPFFNNASAILYAHDAYRFDSAKLAIVDATANKRLSKKFHVTSYPTMFYTLNGRAYEYNAASSTTDFLQVSAYLFAGKKFKTFADDFSNIKVLEQVLAVENPVRPMLISCTRQSDKMPAAAATTERSAFNIIADATVTYGKVRYGRIADSDATSKFWSSSSSDDDLTASTTSSPWSASTSYLSPDVEKELAPHLKRGTPLYTLSQKERLSVMHWRMKAACWEGWRLIDAKARRRAAMNVTLLGLTRAAAGGPSVLDRLVSSLYNVSSSPSSSTIDTTTEPCTTCFNMPSQAVMELDAATPSVSPDGSFMFMTHDSSERPVYFKGHWGRNMVTALEQQQQQQADNDANIEAEEQQSQDDAPLAGEKEGGGAHTAASASAPSYVPLEENADVIRVEGSSKYQVHSDVFHFFLQFGILAVEAISPERLSHVSKKGKFAVVALGVPVTDLDGEREYVPTLRQLMQERYANHVFAPEHAARMELVKKEYADLANTANRIMRRVFKRYQKDGSSSAPVKSTVRLNADDEIMLSQLKSKMTAISKHNIAAADSITAALLSTTSSGKDPSQLLPHIVADRKCHRRPNSIFAELEAKAYPQSVLFPKVPISRTATQQRGSRRLSADISSQHLSTEAANVLYGHPIASTSKILHLFVGNFAIYKDWVQTYGYTGDTTPVLFVADMKREIGWRIEDWLPPGRTLTYSNPIAAGLQNTNENENSNNNNNNNNGVDDDDDDDQSVSQINRTIATITSFFSGVETGEVKGVSTSYMGMIALLLLDNIPFMTEIHGFAGGDNSMFVLVVGCLIMFVFVLILSIVRGVGPDEEEPPIRGNGPRLQPPAIQQGRTPIAAVAAKQPHAAAPTTTTSAAPLPAAPTEADAPQN